MLAPKPPQKYEIDSESHDVDDFESKAEVFKRKTLTNVVINSFISYVRNILTILFVIWMFLTQKSNSMDLISIR